MTNIATNINIENRAKELAKEIIKESTDEKIVKKMAKEVAKEAVFEIMNKGKDRRFQNTKILMMNYISLKQHIVNGKDEFAIVYNLMEEDTIEVEYMWLESIVKSKGKTIQMIKYIDEQLEYLEKKYDENNQSEKYKAFIMLTVEGKTITDIMDEIGCGKNSPNNWNKEIISELSVLLWGLDAISM